jgi:hypothetical protein
MLEFFGLLRQQAFFSYFNRLRGKQDECLPPHHPELGKLIALLPKKP